MGLAVGAWRLSPAPRGYVHMNVLLVIECISEMEETPGGTWGWPSQARHKRPRSTPIATLVFSPVLLFFETGKAAYVRICSHFNFRLFYLDSNPRRFT